MDATIDLKDKHTDPRGSLSIVIPTAVGADALAGCLRSLSRQSAQPDRFEVVVAHYGPEDGSRAAVALQQCATPDMQVRYLHSAGATRSEAKNLALNVASGDLIMCLRSRDRLSDGYVAGVLAGPPEARRVVVPIMVETRGAGPIDFNSVAIRRTLSRASGEISAAAALSSIAGAEGLVYPRSLIASVGFDADLHLGEEAVLLEKLLAAASPTFFLPEVEDSIIYYRSQIAVTELARLETSVLLDSFSRLADFWPDPKGNELHRLVANLATAELNDYLQVRPDAHAAVVEGRRSRRLEEMVDLNCLNRGVARDLAVLYTSVPYVDTSANVAARRIAGRAKVVDVISNDMSSRLPVDPSSHALWAEYVDEQVELRCRIGSTRWAAINSFCRKALKQVSKLETSKGPYRSVYSRVMHPTSHFLAAWLRLRRPNMTWLAEMSDPVRVDIRGQARPSSGKPDPVMAADFKAGLRARGFNLPSSENLHLWLETVTYAVADQIMFNNANQRHLMLDTFPDSDIARRAMKHSVISRHPTPEARHYDAVHSEYRLPQDRVNLAYFGVFYSTRGLSEVWAALQRLDDRQRQRILLHVFTKRPDDLDVALREANLIDVVRANPYISYLEYLNLSSRVDVLLINDARANDAHGLNPYLPSKWSDYSGSGSKVWGIVESGSTLSACTLDYRTELGDVDGAADVLASIVAGFEGGEHLSDPSR